MNLANIITLFRLLLVPVYLWIFFSNLENRYTLAMGVYLLAGLSDVLDGYIARSRNLITKLGIALDPLADKIMAITVIATFTYIGAIPFWVLILFILKETVMIIVSAIFYFNHYKISIPSNVYGKLGTFLLYMTILSIALEIPILKDYAIYPTVAVNILAFVIYGKNLVSALKNHNAKEEI